MHLQHRIYCKRIDRQTQQLTTVVRSRRMTHANLLTVTLRGFSLPLQEVHACRMLLHERLVTSVTSCGTGVYVAPCAAMSESIACPWYLP
jgi:hypothetical protein